MTVCSRKKCGKTLKEWIPVIVSYGYGSAQDGETEWFCSDECVMREFSTRLTKHYFKTVEGYSERNKAQAKARNHTPEGRAYYREALRKWRANRKLRAAQATV